ncbi:hypothetical protein LZ30DRAFT_704882 [Colletotrichum cereale]|nr:hypothetical protein LZ30DRAFT_704882 [Colletotrichum cereale]
MGTPSGGWFLRKRCDEIQHRGWMHVSRLSLPFLRPRELRGRHRIGASSVCLGHHRRAIPELQSRRTHGRRFAARLLSLPGPTRLSLASEHLFPSIPLQRLNGRFSARLSLAASRTHDDTRLTGSPGCTLTSTLILRVPCKSQSTVGLARLPLLAVALPTRSGSRVGMSRPRWVPLTYHTDPGSAVPTVAFCSRGHGAPSVP